MSYTRGLHEVGDGLYAYLQPDGGWGWSNAGLIVDGEATLLVDTLFDLRLTGEMLDDMRRAVPAARRIDTLVNTHANGDHCYGNELVGGARIVASARTAEEMPEAPPALMAGIKAQAGQLGRLGAYFMEIFGPFHFDGVSLVLPQETFTGERTLTVGDREVRLAELGPAHTRGDTIVHLPRERVVYTGDLLFNGGHPIAWAGPVSNWIAACDHLLSLDVDVVVPGHGPLADLAAVAEMKAYLEHLTAEARRCHAAGMTPLQAARDVALDRWADWGEGERVVVTIAALYRELEGGAEAPDIVALMGDMAELAADRRGAPDRPGGAAAPPPGSPEA